MFTCFLLVGKVLVGLGVGGEGKRLTLTLRRADDLNPGARGNGRCASSIVQGEIYRRGAGARPVEGGQGGPCWRYYCAKYFV